MFSVCIVMLHLLVSDPELLLLSAFFKVTDYGKGTSDGGGATDNNSAIGPNKSVAIGPNNSIANNSIPNNAASSNDNNNNTDTDNNNSKNKRDASDNELDVNDNNNNAATAPTTTVTTTSTEIARDVYQANRKTLLFLAVFWASIILAVLGFMIPLLTIQPPYRGDPEEYKDTLGFRVLFVIPVVLVTPFGWFIVMGATFVILASPMLMKEVMLRYLLDWQLLIFVTCRDLLKWEGITGRGKNDDNINSDKSDEPGSGNRESASGNHATGTNITTTADKGPDNSPSDNVHRNATRSVLQLHAQEDLLVRAIRNFEKTNSWYFGVFFLLLGAFAFLKYLKVFIQIRAILNGKEIEQGNSRGTIPMLSMALTLLFLLIALSVVLKMASVSSSYQKRSRDIFRGYPAWRLSKLLVDDPQALEIKMCGGGGDNGSGTGGGFADIMTFRLFGMPVTNSTVYNVVTSTFLGLVFTMLMPMVTN